MTYYLKPFLYKSFSFLFIILLFTPLIGAAQSSQSLSRELTQKLSELEREIALYRQEIHILQKKNLGLKEELELLEKEVEKNKLQIQASELTLRELKIQSERLKAEVEAINQEIRERKIALSKSLQGMYQLEQRSLLESFLSQQGFSDFFNQMEYLQNLQETIQTALNDILATKNVFDAKKEDLDSQLASQGRLFALQTLQRQELIQSQDIKEQLVKENVSSVFVFERKSKALEEVAAQIKERLYILQGLTESVNLDEAFKRASEIAKRTGIDPVFLMAVLKVESDFGNNIGGGNWREDMHPRQREAFLTVIRKLSLDPDKIPVSRAPRYGWGGAMGPAQFLPNTWLAYEGDIVKITGHNPPSPWDLDDAFAAAALKLARNGASEKTYEGEWMSAMKYFAGGNWRHPAYSFYGDRVMDVKVIIERQLQL